MILLLQLHYPNLILWECIYLELLMHTCGNKASKSSLTEFNSFCAMKKTTMLNLL